MEKTGKREARLKKRNNQQMKVNNHTRKTMKIKMALKLEEFLNYYANN